MRPRIAVFGTLGALATVAAAGLLFVPDLLVGLGPAARGLSALDGTRPRTVLLAASALVGLYLAFAARTAAHTVSAGESGDAFEDATADPPEDATARAERVTGADVEARIAAAAAGDEAATAELRERLRRVAVAVQVRTTDCDRETARRAVATGRWTADRTAAAFLAEGAPVHGLWSRLHLWLDPERERERRIRRTVDATYRLSEAPWGHAVDREGRTTGTERPDERTGGTAR